MLDNQVNKNKFRGIRVAEQSKASIFIIHTKKDRHRFESQRATKIKPWYLVIHHLAQDWALALYSGSCYDVTNIRSEHMSRASNATKKDPLLK